MKLGLEQRPMLGLQQKLVITPQLQQAIKLLQLSHMELMEVLQEELLENPVLEIQDVEDEGGSVDGDVGRVEEESRFGETQAEAGGEHETNELMGEIGEGGLELGGEGLPSQVGEEDTRVTQEDLFQEIDWEAYFQDVESFSPTLPSMGGDFDADLPSLEQRFAEQETLQDHLMWQLRMVKLSQDEQKMAVLIVGSLDERGWLVLEDQGDADPLDILARQMVDEMRGKPATSNGHDPEEDPAFARWRKAGEVALQAIHRMEPVGVGARSLSECLLLQVWQRNDWKDPDLLERLIRDHLQSIEQQKFANIAKKIKISLRELLENVACIRQLEPQPSRRFITQPTAYVEPDIHVKKVGNQFEVVLDDDGLPNLKINAFYRQMLREQSKEGKEFIQDKLRSAQWLLRSIQQRKRTIYRVTQSIVKRQQDFLEHGISHLKPMILRDVAEDIEMHESTISRVTTNKYVHTPQGVFELKFFFTSSLQSSEGGEDVSSLAVKEKIRQLVADEDPKEPISDQDIVKVLESDGVSIARRTVAKYRSMLGIASSSKRKRPY